MSWVNLRGFLVAAVIATTPSVAATVGRAELADAVAQGDKATIQSLLKQHADVNAPQADGTTPLHWAVRIDDVDLVNQLVASGANVNAVNRFGVTPIHLAATNGNAATLQSLLKAGADANAALPKGETVLMTAARTGDLDAIRVLLASGANINAKESWRGQTALMWAVAEGHTSVVQMLIQRGADVSARSNVVQPPPGRGGRPGGDPSGGMTALVYAARQGDLESATALVAGKADVNQTAGDGSSPLVVAIMNANYGVATFLLDHGADPNIADVRGLAALYAAIDTRDVEKTTRPDPKPTGNVDSLDLIKMILAHGANVNLQLKKSLPSRGAQALDGNWYNLSGATAFIRAAKSADLVIMRLLLANNADPNIKTLDKSTALMAAAGLGWSEAQTRGSEIDALEAVKMCVELGNDVNAVNESLPGALFGNGSQSQTALHGAAARGSNLIVQYLVDRGARLDIKDRVGRTPLNIAEGVFYGAAGYIVHPDTAALLRQLMKLPVVAKE